MAWIGWRCQKCRYVFEENQRQCPSCGYTVYDVVHGRPLVVELLKRGHCQFGHAGRHHGTGAPDCPRELHHHHDELCDIPTVEELKVAGIDPKKFKSGSRA